MITFTEITTKIKELSTRVGLFSIPLPDIFGLISDIVEKLREINSSASISLSYLPSVQTKAQLYTEYPEPEDRNAVLVESEGYIYQYQASKEDWFITPFPAFPSDVALKGGTEKTLHEVDINKVSLYDVQLAVNESTKPVASSAVKASILETNNHIGSMFPLSLNNLGEDVLQYIEASGGGTITNMPDEEDITINDNKLKFKNKAYSPFSASGLGRTYLQKNIVSEANVLVQNMLANVNTIYHIQYDYNLNGATINVPANSVLHFDGGSFANGKIVLNNTFIKGTNGGFAKDVIITGSLRNGDFYFDWYKNEKIVESEYTTFINGRSSEFSTKPIVGDSNRIILTNLCAISKYSVRFGRGIYGFDEACNINTSFWLKGVSMKETLLCCPNSEFIYMTTGGAVEPYIKDICIESWGSVLKLQAWTVNAIHALLVCDARLMSYADHTIQIDRSQSGGTGAPIYGCKFQNVVIYAGKDKGMFYEILSGSNVFDNVVDAYDYFKGGSSATKGIPKAMFWNSNVLSYTNSNIIYGGMQYLLYTDRLSGFKFYLHHNVFENVSDDRRLRHIGKFENGNVYLRCVENTYINENDFDNGCFFWSSAPNMYIEDLDARVARPYSNTNIALYGSGYRNLSDKPFVVRSSNIHGSGTTSEIALYRPYSSTNIGNPTAYKTYNIPANTARAASLGILGYYAGHESEISYFSVKGCNMRDVLSFIENPLETDGEGANGMISKTKEAANCFSFGHNEKYYKLHGLAHNTVRSVTTKAEYDALYSANFTSGIIIIADSIDLGGATISIRNNITLLFLGGSINNGTITLNATTDIINFTGTAILSGVCKRFGATANRPSGGIKGYMFFDTTLNKPIWYNGSTWVDSAGITV